MTEDRGHLFSILGLAWSTVQFDEITRRRESLENHYLECQWIASRAAEGRG